MPVLYRCTFLLIFQAFLLTFVVSESQAQWVKLPQFNDGTFYNEVYFYDQNLGFITTHSGSVLRTANGGTSWTTVTMPNTSFSANRDISFVSTSIGFISGEDGIWKTTDGGLTWTDVTPAGATNIGSTGCWFRNASVGVWGYGNCADTVVTFWSTTDGGSTWASVSYSHTTDVAVGGIAYIGNTFYAAGGSGKFWKSTDDGANWTLSNTGSAGWQEDLIASAGSLLIASADGTSCGSTGGGKLLLSVNGGTSWTTTTYPGTVMWGISMYSAANGWAVGDLGKAYKTVDGGVTWVESSCGLDPTDRLDDVWMISATQGFAVGDGIYRFAINEFVAQPDTIDFGDVIIGTMRGDSVASVRAVGPTGTVSARAILGANPTEFSSPSSLLNAQTIPECDIASTLLRFIPNSVGPKTARLEFTITGLATPLVVYLKGNGVKPDIVGPIKHRLDTLLCENEELDTLTFSNVGDYPLTIDSAMIINNLGVFTLESPNLPIVLQPFQNQQFIVKGRATGTGGMSARLYLYMNDPEFQDSAWITDLSMYKRRIQADVRPDTLVIIPSRPLDSTSTICIRYINTGDGVQTVSQVAAFSADPTIATTFTDPVDLQSGDSTIICFTARALDTLGRCKRFRVLTQPCGIETFMTVCYQAAEGRLDMLKSLTLQAGCGETLLDTVVIRNTGNDSAFIDSVSVRGVDLDRFELMSPDMWPVAIPAGDSLQVVVAFTPGATSTYTAELVLYLQNGSEETVELVGKRNAPVVELKERMNDIGFLCPDEIREVVVQLTNVGNQETAITSVTLLDAEDRMTLRYTPSNSLVPLASDSIVISVAGSSVGPIFGRFLVEYDSECLDPDTIVVQGIVLDRSLTFTLQPLDFGVVPVGRTGIARTVVRNTSDTIITVRILDPNLPGVIVTHPSNLVQLNPGDTVEVTLQFAPEEELQLDGFLQIEGFGRCNEDYEVPVKGSAITEKLYLSGNLDFGIIRCDESPRDSIYVFNAGLSDVEMVTAIFVDANGLTRAFTPMTIRAGDSALIVVSVTPDLKGLHSTELVVTLIGGTVSELRATITVERQFTDTRFVDGNGEFITAFDLPLFAECRTTLDTSLQLRNLGNVHDTLDLFTTVPGVLDVTTPLPLIIPPGETRTVRIQTIIAAIARFTPIVRAESRVCGQSVDAQTVVEYVDVQQAISGTDVDFGVRCLEKGRTANVMLRNDASYPINISQLSVSDPTFTLSESDPFELQPGTERVISVTFLPTVEGSYAGQLVLITDSPCQDTITFPLAGEGMKCLLPDLVLRPANGRGRWGTVQRIPVIVDGTNLNVAQRLSLQMKASPQLLHPESVQIASQFAGEWSVGSQSFDASEGILSISLNGSGVSGETSGSVNNGDTLFYLNYRVLRGSEISTPLELSSDSIAPGGTVRTELGEFLLEDYCDAHGRLLNVTGNLALRTSVPNPAREQATIEYELPFGDHTTLSLFNESGAEVLRILDDIVPAGRRQSVVDVSDLPSGTYTIRLRIGLQTLTQRMVIAQ